MKTRSKLVLMNCAVLSALLLASFIFYWSSLHQATAREFGFLIMDEYSSLSRLKSETQKFTSRSGTFSSVANSWESAYYISDPNIILMKAPSTENQRLQGFHQFLEEWRVLRERYGPSILAIIDTLRRFPAINSDRFSLSLAHMERSMRGNKAFKNELHLLKSMTRKMQHFHEGLSRLLDGIFEKAPFEEVATVPFGPILLAGFIVLFVLFSVLFSFDMIGMQIGAQIRRTNDAFTKIAQGDYTTSIAAKGDDEFKTLATNFSSFVAGLRSSLGLLNTVAGAIATAATDLDSLKSTALSLAMKHSHADGGAFFMASSEGLIRRAISVGDHPPTMKIPSFLSSQSPELASYIADYPYHPKDSPLMRPFLDGKPLFIRDNLGIAISSEDIDPFSFSDETSPKKNEYLVFNVDSENDRFISSCIALPLVVDNKVLGIVSLVKTKRGEFFSDLDNIFLGFLCEYVSLSFDNLLKREELFSKQIIDRGIRIASDIQKALIPPPPEKIPIRIAALSRAARGVSGDYYDYFLLDKNRLIVAVCDMAGKGISASVGMVMIRTVLRLIVQTRAKEAGAIITALNKGMTEVSDGGDCFATGMLFVFDYTKGELSYTNAAHLPLVIYRKDTRKLVQFDAEGIPLGIDRESRYASRMIKVNPGDLLFLCTDGVTEARNAAGEEYGLERLFSDLAPYLRHDHSPDEIIARVGETIDHFTKGTPQHDDQTLLVARIL